MATEPSLSVKVMNLDDVDLRIGYFHDATDDYLRTLGVARELLPSREAWRAEFKTDFARPLPERASYGVIWQLDGAPVGFSTTDRIMFGSEAFMHLHVVDPALRQRGLGTEFVKLSAALYFRDLQLERLYCEPNAFNVAPNRTLQRAGFSYQFTHEATPSPINFPQVTTVWLLERPS